MIKGCLSRQGYWKALSCIAHKRTSMFGLCCASFRCEPISLTPRFSEVAPRRTNESNRSNGFVFEKPLKRLRSSPVALFTSLKRGVNETIYCGSGLANTPAMNSFRPASEFSWRNL
jgi:hypothetical protein